MDVATQAADAGDGGKAALKRAAPTQAGSSQAAAGDLFGALGTQAAGTVSACLAATLDDCLPARKSSCYGCGCGCNYGCNGS